MENMSKAQPYLTSLYTAANTPSTRKTQQLMQQQQLQVQIQQQQMNALCPFYQSLQKNESKL